MNFKKVLPLFMIISLSSCVSEPVFVPNAVTESITAFSTESPADPELKIAGIDPDIVNDTINRKPDPNYIKVHPKYYNQRYPIVVMAHRGFDDSAPENTMSSFRKALQAGANMIELDVHLSKDGQLVIMHDSTIDRTTTGKGAVKDRTLEELRQLDAGIKFSKVFAGEKIPTLDEVLTFAKGKISVNIEIKSDAVLDNPKPGMGVEEKVVNLVKKYNMEEYVMVSAFKGKTLRRIKVLSPKISTGLLMISDGLFKSQVDYVSAVKADAVHEFSKFVSKRDMNLTLKYNIKQNAWTVNDPHRMGELIDRGVDGLITDRPDLALRVIAEKYPHL